MLDLHWIFDCFVSNILYAAKRCREGLSCISPNLLPSCIKMWHHFGPNLDLLWTLGSLGLLRNWNQRPWGQISSFQLAQMTFQRGIWDLMRPRNRKDISLGAFTLGSLGGPLHSWGSCYQVGIWIPGYCSWQNQGWLKKKKNESGVVPPTWTWKRCQAPFICLLC
jgi:hypothetical protein